MAVNYLVVIASKTVDLEPFGPFVEGLGLKFVKFVALVALVQEPQSSAAMAINSGFLDGARDGKTRLDNERSSRIAGCESLLVEKEGMKINLCAY